MSATAGGNARALALRAPSGVLSDFIGQTSVYGRRGRLPGSLLAIGCLASLGTLLAAVGGVILEHPDGVRNDAFWWLGEGGWLAALLGAVHAAGLPLVIFAATCVMANLALYRLATLPFVHTIVVFELGVATGTCGIWIFFVFVFMLQVFAWFFLLLFLMTLAVGAIVGLFWLFVETR